MISTTLNNSVDILLIEHNFDNSFPIQEFFKEKRVINNVHIVRDGIDAIDFFRNESIFKNSFYSCLLMIDLNVPYCREVFEAIIKDKSLRNLPLIILTEMAEDDLLKTYSLPVNYHIVRPADLNKCLDIINSGEKNSFSFQLNNRLMERNNSYLM